MLIQELQTAYKLEDELEASSESLDSGIDSPKLDAAAQESDNCDDALPNSVQNPHSRIERILHTLNIEDCNDVNNLFYILNILPFLIRKIPNINYDSLIYKEAFSFLKEHGIDFNSQDEHGRTSLHLAILNDDIDAVEHLLTIKNINPFIQANNGRTPFDYAKEKPKILKMLIEAEYKYGNTKNKFFHFAVKHNQTDVVKYLVEDQGYEIDLTDCQQSTPLHIASMEGHVNIVKYLITKGANVNYVSRLGDTALILAASCIDNNEKDHLKIIKFLVRNGVDINFVPERDKCFVQKPTLHFAVEHFIQDSNQDSLDIISYLLSLPKLNVNICDDCNETVLHYVVKSKLDVDSQLKILGILLTRKDIDLSVADNKGKSPLSYAQGLILDVLHRYIEIKNNYEIAKSNNPASYSLAILVIAASFVLIAESSSILLDETTQDDRARYMCINFIVIAAVSMLISVSILICNHIEKEKIEKNFEHQREGLTKSDNNVSDVLIHPQIENITCIKYIL